MQQEQPADKTGQNIAIRRGTIVYLGGMPANPDVPNS